MTCGIGRRQVVVHALQSIVGLAVDVGTPHPGWHIRQRVTMIDRVVAACRRLLVRLKKVARLRLRRILLCTILSAAHRLILLGLRRQLRHR